MTPIETQFEEIYNDLLNNSNIKQSVEVKNETDLMNAKAIIRDCVLSHKWIPAILPSFVLDQAVNKLLEDKKSQDWIGLKNNLKMAQQHLYQNIEFSFSETENTSLLFHEVESYVFHNMKNVWKMKPILANEQHLNVSISTKKEMEQWLSPDDIQTFLNFIEDNYIINAPLNGHRLSQKNKTEPQTTKKFKP